MRQVYAFDFDGTLTTRDTFVAFIRHVHGTTATWLGFLLFSPLLVLMKLHRYPNWKTKQRVFSHFFKGMDEQTFNDHCRDFATHASLLRPAGMQQVGQAVAGGHAVVIVSASIRNWVEGFFAPGVAFACTEVEVDADHRLTGHFLTPNCYGQEKVSRLLALYPDRKDYRLTAYGDSRGDRELLAFADESHYKPFRS